MRHLDLFSGIGGFALAASWVWLDHEIVGFCEKNKYCQKILAKHWPSVPIHEDIYDLKGQPADLVTGGFPCQPFSTAGKRRGKNDNRYLWPEMLRVIRESQPTWIVGENVAGIVNMALDQVLIDLGMEGYACQCFIIPACAVDGPHRRDRVWIVGNAASVRQHRTGPDTRGKGKTKTEGRVQQPERTSQDVAHATQLHSNGSDSEPRRKVSESGNRGSQDMCNWPTEPNVGRVAHGIPRKLDGLDIREGYMLLLTYANKTLSDPREVLRALRNQIDSPEVQQWKTGMPNHVSSPQVLQLYLRQLKERCDEEFPSQKSEEVQENILRIMRSQKELTGSPCGSGLPEQHTGEHPDSLQALSRLLAQSCYAAWEPHRGTYATDRIDRLRSLGNAIVPQVAEQIFRAIQL